MHNETYFQPVDLGGYMDWMSLQINQQTLRMVELGKVSKSSTFLPTRRSVWPCLPKVAMAVYD